MLEVSSGGGDMKAVRHRMRSLAYKYERKRLVDIGTDDVKARKEACEFATRTAEKPDSKKPKKKNMKVKVDEKKN